MNVSAAKAVRPAHYITTCASYYTLGRVLCTNALLQSGWCEKLYVPFDLDLLTQKKAICNIFRTTPA